MYEVIGTRASRAFRVLWMLEELGVTYIHTPSAPRSAEVQQANPSGKIPVLKSDGGVITDSVAIMTYLGDVHGAFSYPAGTFRRAQQDAFTLQILDDVDAILWTAARHSFVLPEENRVPDVKASLQVEFAANIARLAEAVAGPFLICLLYTSPSPRDS